MGCCCNDETRVSHERILHCPLANHRWLVDARRQFNNVVSWILLQLLQLEEKRHLVSSFAFRSNRWMNFPINGVSTTWTVDIDAIARHDARRNRMHIQCGILHCLYNEVVDYLEMVAFALVVLLMLLLAVVEDSRGQREMDCSRARGLGIIYICPVLTPEGVELNVLGRPKVWHYSRGHMLCNAGTMPDRGPARYI